MQGGRIALGGHTRPFAEGIKCYINIVRTVAAFVARSGPDKVWKRFETHHHLRRFDVDAVNVLVICALDFGAMQLRTSNENVDETVRVRKT